jgi:hypothetical protein
MEHTRTQPLILFALASVLAITSPAFADIVLNHGTTFPEIKPYSGPVAQPVIKSFSFPRPGRYQVRVTYGPWYRVTNEMFLWRSSMPIDGRDFGAWVPYIPGATTVSSRSEPEIWADAATLQIISEITVRQAQPGMQVAIFPPVVRFGDGSAHQLPASAKVEIVSLSESGANTSSATTDAVWTVEEPDFEGGFWRGTWTRRGDSNVYDAYWTHPTRGEQRDVLEFRGMEGSRFIFWRRGLNGTYSAQVGADGRTITGGAASWYPAGWTWKGVKGGGAPSSRSSANAPKQAFDPGRVWTVEEPDFAGGIWYGTWTRRGNSSVYDAYWRHTSGREHRGTVEFRGIDGRRITFFRQDVNGTYSGELGSDGRSIRGGTTTWYPSGWTWTGSRSEP